MPARSAARRLPGVQFERRPPPPAEALPRMDVAAFVGFAASGPLNTPVPVDDPAAFADVFGGDAELAWDRERGAPQVAQLGAAVRAFFRNGGSRCWVVRVARTLDAPHPAPNDWARANRFPVPGLARLSGAALRPAILAARSEGSWSDRLGVGAAIQLLPVAPGLPIKKDGHGRVTSVRLEVPDEVLTGDLLRLTWSAGSPTQPAAALLAPVISVGGDGKADLGADQLWLLSAPPPSGSPWLASWFPQGEGPKALAEVQGEPAWSGDGTVALQLPADLPELAGAFLLLIRGAEQVWVVVDSALVDDGPGSPAARRTRLTGRWSRPSFAAPPGLLADSTAAVAGERVRVELWVREGSGHPRRLPDLGLAPGHPRFLGALPSDQRLFEPDEDMLTPEEAALRNRVRALAGDGVELRSYHAELWHSAANPRFPLAVDGSQTDVYLPLGLPLLPAQFLAALPAPGNPLERDGLGRFDDSLFLDPRLAGETARSLAAQADFIRWQQPSPQRLRGIHAALALEEVTLIAAPDAAQRGWSMEHVQAPEPLATPLLSASADAQGRWHLAWTSVDPEASYALESAADEAFSSPYAVALGAPGATAYDVPAAVPSGTWFRVRAFRRKAVRSSYFDVGDPEIAGSFWSDPVQVLVPPPAFRECPPGALGAPALSLAGPPDINGTLRLRWAPVAGAVGYEVQQSTALDFSGAVTVSMGAATEAVLHGRAAGRYHFRARVRGSFAQVSAPWPAGGSALRLDVTGVATGAHVVAARAPGALRDEVVFDGARFTERFTGPGNAREALASGFRYTVTRAGGWPGAPELPSFSAWDSAALGRFGECVSATVPAPARRVLHPLAAYPAAAKQALLAVQRALLEMCAARGDLLAVLSLPEHYREVDAVRHVAELRSGHAEDAPLSHGALYHPWLLVEGRAGVAAAPPDGAMCGVMARRAMRGAWIAPANEPLGDVLGLTPGIGREQWGRLLDARVNLVRKEPHGFVVLGADTLALDPDLVPINVRRLLSLLRRAALRLGPTFVFEPNNGAFRRAVERTFTALLDGLFRRGAFAGTAAGEAFQVVVDAAAGGDSDQGRFAVELKVAPSLPLTFLTVRMVQSAGAGAVAEGP